MQNRALRLSVGLGLVSSLNACGPQKPPVPPPPPPIQTMSDFQTKLADRVRSGFGAKSPDFQIIVTEAEYPVGTVMRQGSTIPIAWTDCAPKIEPLKYPMPSQFPSYTLSHSVAADFGLDSSLVSQIADAGVNVKSTGNVQVRVDDPKVEVVADQDLKAILAAPGCAAAIGRQTVWYVRGYIVAQRTFTAATERNMAGKAKVVKVANFNVDASNSSTVGISDAAPVGFLEVISEVAPPSPVETPSEDANPAKRAMVEAVVRTNGARPSTVSAPTAVAVRGEVYVQRDKMDHGGDAARIVASLQSLGLKVAPKVQAIESSKMPTLAQVRYFNTGDAPAADMALKQLRTFHKDAQIVRFGLPAPPGQFEIWLPKVG